MSASRILGVVLIAWAALATGCRPSHPPPVDVSKQAVPSPAAKPIVSDWQVQASHEEIRKAVDEIGAEKQMSAAEADSSLALPDRGVWADLSQAQARALYESIPLDLGLKYTYGNGRNELVVFTDPHNQNDRRLMGLLLANASDLNATLYVFPLPSSDPVSNVERILCTQNPESAWSDWMKQVAVPKNELGGIFTPRMPELDEQSKWTQWEVSHPEKLGCSASDRAMRIDALANELGVSFTPTLIFAHGRAWPGQFPELSDLRDTWGYVHDRLHFLPR